VGRSREVQIGDCRADAVRFESALRELRVEERRKAADGDHAREG
jgi:hypothetical protein